MDAAAGESGEFNSLGIDGGSPDAKVGEVCGCVSGNAILGKAIPDGGRLL